MKKDNLLKVLSIIGGLIFALLFWKEKLGLNTIIFSIFLWIVFLIDRGTLQNSGKVLIPALGTILASIFIVVNNSANSKIVWVISLLLWSGYNQKKAVHSFYNAVILGFSSFLESPLLLIKSNWNNSNKTAWKAFWKKISILIIPLALLALFFGIYYAANPKFANLYHRIHHVFQRAFSFELDAVFLLLTLVGLMLSSGLFFTSALNNFFHKIDSNKTELLIRKRKKTKNLFSTINFLSLKKEYQIAVIVLGLLNLQLIVVNGLDLAYVWFTFEERNAVELSQFVHEGTGFLILSILLAIGIILWFFRGNLNFIAKNKFLKNLVYIWIIQNAFLALSVGMRNFHYVNAYGLAYLRIGVFFFLILVLYGLWTIKEKVSAPKSFYYLFQKNAWFFYFCLLAFSGINWHIAITKFNLSKQAKNGIDVSFLVKDVGDQNLYILFENEELLHQNFNSGKEKLEEALDNKKQKFINKQSSYSWKSFNVPDWRNRSYFDKIKKPNSN